VAGYDTGARLEYLLVPLVFGLGAPLVAAQPSLPPLCQARGFARSAPANAYKNQTSTLVTRFSRMICGILIFAAALFVRDVER
jgi:hypothetical protein